MSEESSITDAKTAAQAEMFANRLSKRAKHLRKWARRIGTDAFRVYDRDIPEIPLLLDIYGDAAAGALYERPYEKDELDEERWLSAMTDAAADALSIRRDRILLKFRKRQRGADQYGKVDDVNLVAEVHENGLKFSVNLSDYLDTGLFLDHRATRALVRGEASGLRVLNLFCYTASFSVHAAAGGAAEVDSVDLSNTYLDWADVNFKLNGYETTRIEPQAYVGGASLPGKFRLVRADALRFIEEAARKRRRWDLIILDPPTFSNSKKMEGTLDVRRDYVDLVRSCLSLLAPGGTLWFSTNARGFKLDASEFPEAEVRDMGGKNVDEDFKGRSLRACYTLRV